MQNCITDASLVASLVSTTGKKRFSTGLAIVGSDIASGFMTTARHGFTLLSVAGIAITATVLVRPEVANQLTAASPFAATANTTVGRASLPMVSSQSSVKLAPSDKKRSTAPAEQALAANEAHATEVPGAHVLGDISKRTPAPAATRQQQVLVTNWLAKKYRVAGDATDMLVSAAYTTARDIKLDPLLILSVMAIESGLNPFAESPVGAQGLMQVMSKVHHEKFRPMGGVKAALNPVANIKVGSLILKDYVNRGGSVEAGLKLYVGAAAFDTDFGYGSRVLAEYQRLKQVAVGKTVPTSTSYAAAKTKPTPAASGAVATTSTTILSLPSDTPAAAMNTQPGKAAATLGASATSASVPATPVPALTAATVTAPTAASPANSSEQTKPDASADAQEKIATL